MDDPLLVGVGEPLGGLADQAERLAERERRALLEPLREVGAGDELEGEEEHALVLAGVEEGDDVGVQEPAGGACLAQQPALALFDLLGPALLRCGPS